MRAPLKCLAVSMLAALLSTHLFAATTNTSVEEVKTLARLYSAAFDRDPKTEGLNFWVRSYEDGRSVVDIAKDFYNSPEFIAKYGTLTNRGYVEQLFRNVLGREGASEGIEFWIGNLDSGTSRARVLSKFSDSPENIVKTSDTFDSMRFVDGQWQFGERVAAFCPDSACLQAQLNGSVGGASIVITPLRTNATLATPVSYDQSSLVAALGANVWNGLSGFERLESLGVFVAPGVQPSQLYLLSASGGADYDNNLDQQADTQPTPVLGEWHAIMTGAQMRQAGNQVSALTEVLYRSVVNELEGLSDAQLLRRLDAAARKVVSADLTGDGVVDYQDVLAWTRLTDSDRLVGDPGDLDRLALAVQAGQDGAAVYALSNRVLAGPAAVGLDETTAVKRSPDGTCEGRGAAIISLAGESITTLPPSSACGSDDPGSVVSNQGSLAAEIKPGKEGTPANVDIGNVSLEIDQTGLTNKQLRVRSRTRQGAEPTVTILSNPSPKKQAGLSNKYLRMSRRDAVQAGSVASSSPMRTVYGQGGSGSGGMVAAAATPEEAQFDDTLTDAMTYGALASSWTSCLAVRLFAELDAQGQVVPAAAREWAVAGCTSALVEVDTWVAQSSPAELERFEAQVPAVELEGCADCYSYIASPTPGRTVLVGERVEFNGVAPADSLSRRWTFGDGGSYAGWSTRHSYSEPGLYTARFAVGYSNGTSGSKAVTVEVQAAEGCSRPPVVNAGADRTVDADSLVVLAGSGTVYVPPDCSISSYEWQQLDSGPSVVLGNAYSATASFEAPPVDVDTTFSFRLTVVDSDGNVGSDTVDVTVRGYVAPTNATYSIDNGALGDSVGCPQILGDDSPYSIEWANRFDVIPGGEVITEILVAFGDVEGLNLNGYPVQVRVYEDIYSDGTPAEAILRGTADGVISNYASGIFNVFDVNDIFVSGTFFISVVMDAPNGSYPAAIDSAASIGESWTTASCISGWGSNSWNYMIRANAIEGTAY